MQGVSDPAIIEAFEANGDNPFIVSFPRTGSHWLRMLMELYFDKPMLTRKFFLLDREDYMAIHSHDDDLDVERTNVIYLWRDPVDTVFSQMTYHGEESNDHDAIEMWSEAYGKHLNKWLITERFTKKKLILNYAELIQDASAVLRRVSEYFGVSFDAAKAWDTVSRVTKDEVKRRTKYDDRVIKVGEGYARERVKFRMFFAVMVWRSLLRGREELAVFMAGVDE